MGRREIGKRKLNARFFVRILPTLDFALDSIKIQSNLRVMHVKCLQNFKKVKKQNFWRFTADDIFWNKSQEEVYGSVCGELIEKALDGVNCAIVAYGQRGSGKTFTVSGLRHRYEERGLLLRLLSALCNERSSTCDFKKITITMTYVEFLRYEMKDLFGNRSVEKFKDLKKKEIIDEIDAWKSIFEAEVRKSFDYNAAYPGSHRGHTIFTFHVESLSLIESHPVCTYSKVHVVDMAGIDSGNSSTTWRCTTDIGYSNLSKSLMEQLILCVSGKTWKSPGWACSFKTTKLLEYLEDTLRPHCMLRFIGHIIGSESYLPLTLSVLRFGEKVRGFHSTPLKSCSREVTEEDSLATLRALEAELERLRIELDFKEMLTDSPNYSNLSQEKLEQIRRAAKNFLVGNVDKLTLLNLGHAEITLDVFRDLYERLTREKEQAVKEAVLAAIEEVQLQLPSDKAHSVVHLASGQAKTSRRRSSRQHDSQASLVASLRLKASESNLQSIGETEKKVIGMSSPTFESPLAKALKKVKSSKTDNTIVRPEPKSDSVENRGIPSSTDFSSVDFQAILPEKIPSREEAWQYFCAERSDVVQSYQEEILRLEENVRISRKNYVIAICELGKARNALEQKREECDDWKHTQFLQKGSSEEELQEKLGQIFGEELRQKEIEIDNVAERCHIALIDYRNNVDALAEAKNVLENEFQMFCEDVYNTAVVPEDNNRPEREYTRSSESVPEMDGTDHFRMEMYSRFRRKMLNHVPKRKKEVWVARF